MSDEIICLSSSDDEDARCIENSTNLKTKSHNVTKKRRLSDSSFEDKFENKVKKQKINNGIINIDEYDEDSKPKSDLNSNHKKSIKFESTTPKSRDKSTSKRSPSPIAGTSKYFDLIENQVPKKNTYKKDEKLPPSVSQNLEATRKKISCDESNKKNSTPVSEKPIKKIKPQLIVREVVPIPDPSEDIFEKILETCRKKRNNEEMRIILANIKKYYDQLAPIDKNCEEFRLYLNSCLNKIQNSDQFLKLLVNIKAEMVRRIKINAKTGNEDNNEESEEIELTEEDAMKVRKLEKVIKKCKAKIERLENQEVDFDEEDNSVYLMVDRYKKKLVELCDELCRIAKDKILRKQIHKKLLRRKDIPDEMTGIIYVDEAIIRFINSSIKQANELKHIKNPNAVASYLLMPDYVDILQCIKQCNEERNLELKNKKMEKLAEKAFKAVGNYLKNQRLQEIKEYLASFVENSEADPAKSDHDLNKKLKSNKEVGMKKLEGIFAKYVAKQEGLSSEGSASENEENDSCEDESNDDGNSKNNNEDISSSSNEDNASSRDEDNSSDKDTALKSRKKIIPTISSDDDTTEENIENKESCKENNARDTNEMNKENVDDTETNTLQEKFSGCTASTTFEKQDQDKDKDKDKDKDNDKDKDKEKDNDKDKDKEKDKGKEKIEPSRSINETVNILSEICEVSNSSNINENKPSCDSGEDEIEILSDDNDTDKENNKSLENETSQDIVLEIEDEDPLSITEGNVKKNDVDNNDASTSDVNCAAEEKKKKIQEEKHSFEIQNKNITTSNSSDQGNKSKQDLKDDNHNDSSKIINENTIEVNNIANVGKFYPLHQSMTVQEDTHMYTNKKASSADEILDVTKEPSFLKVKSFARPPESWKDTSPEKPAKNPKLSIQQPIKRVLQQMSKPECVDLTNENESRYSSSTRIINPLALKKHRIPANKLVVVKNVVNNCNFSLPADGGRDMNRSIPQSKVQFISPQVKNVLISKASGAQVNQVPPNNHNQRSNETSVSIVRTPFVTVPSTKKRSNNSNSPSTVK